MGKNKLLTQFSLFVAVSGLSVALAAPSTTTAPAATVATKAPSPFSATLDFARTNSLNDYQDGTEQASWDSALILGYKLNKDYSLSALAERSEDIKNSENSDWASAAVRLTKSRMPVLNNKVELMPRLSVGLPISKTQKFASFKGSTGLSLRAYINPEILFSPKLSLDAAVSITRSFHEYDTATSGAVNNRYSSVQDVNIGWNFTDALSAGIAVIHQNAWTYQGTMKEYYSHEETLSYQVNDNVGVTLGHVIGLTTVWNADYSNYDFKLTDEDNSLVYASITLTY